MKSKLSNTIAALVDSHTPPPDKTYGTCAMCNEPLYDDPAVYGYDCGYCEPDEVDAEGEAVPPKGYYWSIEGKWKEYRRLRKIGE